MGIVVLGIDLGKNSSAWQVWMHRAGLFCGVGCGGVHWRALSEVLNTASWQWKLAAIAEAATRPTMRFVPAAPLRDQNPHSRPTARRRPAGSFFGGFPMRAPSQIEPLVPSRHPKPIPIAEVGPD